MSYTYFIDPVFGTEVATPGTRGFLQVGEWCFPLMPAQSPVLHSFYGAYIFPDPTNPKPGKLFCLHCKNINRNNLKFHF